MDAVNKTENKYAALLNKARKNMPQKKDGQNKTERKEKSEPSKPSIVEFSLMLFLAAFFDMLDFLLIGLVPFVGDIIDFLILSAIIIWIISLIARRYLGLSSAFAFGAAFTGIAVEEIIPLLGDLLPMWIGVVWFIYKKSGKIKKS